MGTAFDDDELQEGLGAGLLRGLRSPAQPGLGASLMQAGIPTFAPPAVDHISVMRAAEPDGPNPAAALNEAMRQEALRNATARPDLGLVGDLSRIAFDGDFSKDMFENYWLGKGPVRLSDDQFKDITETATKMPRPKGADKDVPVTSVDGKPLIRRQFNFYGDDKYKDSLGNASLFYTPDGKPVGFYDKYNFDNTSGKDRKWRTRQEIRAMGFIGPKFGAKDFPLYYGEYAPPE